METMSNLYEQLRILCTYIPGLDLLASEPFLFRPLLMLVVLGTVGGIIGVVINLRCAEFNAEAMVHSVFPGIVAGAVYGGIDSIIPVASAVAVLAALALTYFSRQNVGRTSEAGTAVVLTSFFSFGIVLSLKKGDMSGQLEALMFGRLLEVTDYRLTQALVVCLAAGILVVFAWRGQIYCAFDRVGAAASGISLLRADLVLNVAIAAVVAAASSAVGSLLVIGYLVVPGAAARLLAGRVRSMLAVSIAVGIGGGYLGMLMMLIPAPRPVSPQASVALSVIALYFVALAARTALRTGRKQSASARTDFVKAH